MYVTTPLQLSSSSLSWQWRGAGILYAEPANSARAACDDIIHMGLGEKKSPVTLSSRTHVHSQGRVRVEEANKASAVAVFLVSLDMVGVQIYC